MNSHVIPQETISELKQLVSDIESVEEMETSMGYVTEEEMLKYKKAKNELFNLIKGL